MSAALFGWDIWLTSRLPVLHHSLASPNLLTDDMRFPRLTNLFHRRVKSDPEIHRLASAPLATLETRPVSAERIFDLALSPSSAFDIDTFISYSQPARFTFPPSTPQHAQLTRARPSRPPLAHSTQSTSTTLSSPLRYRPADPVTDQESVVAILTQRIQDLETALIEECDTTALIPDLQVALQDERNARDAAEGINAALSKRVASLQEEVQELRGTLFSAVAAGQQASDAPTSVLAERDRLRHFCRLMVTLGAHKPVIDAAYQNVVHGEDPEAALVDSIKRATAQPDSVWRELLQPVTGPRTQEAYLAQVRCTLDARRQTQDWRKRANFWKRAAMEDGRHLDTVTPSVSALSDIAGELPIARQERVREMMTQLKDGELPLRVSPLTAPSGLLADNSTPTVHDSISASSSSYPQPELDLIADLVDPSSVPPDVSIPANSSSMVLPALSSSSTACMSSMYSNLPPLASETFRASHSIKSMSSRTSRRGMTPSSSTSTTNSVKSRRRRAKVLTLPRISVQPSLPSRSDTEPAVCAAPPSEEPPVQGSRGGVPTSDSLPRALVDCGRGSDEDIVLVLHSDFSETSYRASPPRRRSSASTASGDESVTPDSTPEKRTRLGPVRMPGLRAIKRLSASIAGSRSAPADAISAMVSEWKGEHGKGRARAPSVSSQRSSASEASPSRQPKSPMVRRLQRFGLGNHGDGRR